MDPIRRRCDRTLSGPLLRPMRAALQALVEEAGEEELADQYGNGPLIADFEAEVAALLGKPAAVFFPSGTMAQPLALRLWAERRSCPIVAMHPTSHLLLHEHSALVHVHNLTPLAVGPRAALMQPMDLQRVADPYAALLVELPQREIGGQLPSWDMLQALQAVARERGAALHLDGARLWECGPHYDRPYDELVAGFDSVYVSFYKGLRGIAGAALVGPADLIAEARIWKRRLGGDLISMYPYILSARRGLRERLPWLGACREHARQIAAALHGIPGLKVMPEPPVTPMMHLFLAGEPAVLAQRAREVSAQSGVWLFGERHLQRTDVPGWWRMEVTIFEEGLAVSPLEAATFFRQIVRP
ncbi:MAG: threonine aldolase [Myxococcota bacterium]|jgi:threonine aldolase